MSFNSEFIAESKKLETELNYSVDGQEKDIKVKIRIRVNRRQSLIRIISALEANYPISKLDIVFNIGKLTDLLSNLEVMDSQIESHMIAEELWDNPNCLKQSSLCESYTSKVGNMLDKLKASLDSLKNPIAPNSSNNSSVLGLLKLKLPQVELPNFDGKPETLESFLVSFEKIMGKFSLTQFEKFTYLLQQVSGPAKQLVESVPAGDLNYDVARALLTDAFSNATVQKYSVIDKLLNLKLHSVKKAYQWASEAKILVDQVDRLKIDSNFFCQYFLWNGLSDTFKKQYINITNTAKPCLDEILKNSFEVINRVKDSPTPTEITDSPSEVDTKDKPESKLASLYKNVTLATNVTYDSKKSRYNYKGCWLCQSIGRPNAMNHRFSYCFKFKTPESKLEKIKELNGCTKCGFLNHSVADCKYIFSGRCIKCNQYHSFHLCTKDRKSSQYSKNETVNPTVHKNSNLNVSLEEINSDKNSDSDIPMEQTDANNIDFSVMHANEHCNGNEMLIPTFTLKLPRIKKKKYVDARCMYDPASQTTFITKSVADKLKCRVLEKDISVTITGFNDSKIYQTDIVEFSATVDNDCRKVRAVIVPCINSKVNSSNLPSILTEFKNQKIPLADKYLADINDDGRIDILLGVDYAHILPVYSYSFGSGDKISLLYYTSKGIMLAGDMSNMADSIMHLDKVKGYISQINSLTN